MSFGRDHDVPLSLPADFSLTVARNHQRPAIFADGAQIIYHQLDEPATAGRDRAVAV